MISRIQIQTWLERYGPILFPILGAVLGHFVLFPEKTILQGAFLGALVTLGALLASLTGVSISALASAKSDIADVLQKKGYYKILMAYAHSSVVCSLLLVLVAMAGFFLISPCNEQIFSFYKIILSAVLFSALGMFYRVFACLTGIVGFYQDPK